MSDIKEFWKDMPWYAKLAGAVLGALIYVNILYAKQVPSAIDSLNDKVTAHATEMSIADAQAATAAIELKHNGDEQLRLLRSICVSMAVLSKTDQTKCF